MRDTEYMKETVIKNGNWKLRNELELEIEYKRFSLEIVYSFTTTWIPTNVIFSNSKFSEAVLSIINCPTFYSDVKAKKSNVTMNDNHWSYCINSLYLKCIINMTVLIGLEILVLYDMDANVKFFKIVKIVLLLQHCKPSASMWMMTGWWIRFFNSEVRDLSS